MIAFSSKMREDKRKRITHASQNYYTFSFWIHEEKIERERKARNQFKSSEKRQVKFQELSWQALAMREISPSTFFLSCLGTSYRQQQDVYGQITAQYVNNI